MGACWLSTSAGLAALEPLARVATLWGPPSRGPGPQCPPRPRHGSQCPAGGGEGRKAAGAASAGRPGAASAGPDKRTWPAARPPFVPSPGQAFLPGRAAGARGASFPRPPVCPQRRGGGVRFQCLRTPGACRGVMVASILATASASGPPQSPQSPQTPGTTLGWGRTVSVCSPPRGPRCPPARAAGAGDVAAWLCPQ